MKNLFQSLRVAIVAAFLVSLSVAHANHHEEDKGMLRHVVSLKFNAEATDAQIQDIVDRLFAFPSQIPEVKKVEGGENVSIEDAHKGFTHCFTLTFDDIEGLKVYLPHEDHLALVEKVKPLLDDVFVIDYWVK